MKKLKYLIGLVIIAACWAISVNAICGHSSLSPLHNAIPEELECEAHATQSALDLPTEAEITGIDLLLFDPIPKRAAK